MKHNVKSIISMISEWIILIAPTTGYAIYSYADTLQYSMTATSKGGFWTIISLALLLLVLLKVFKKKYAEFKQGYVQLKTDLKVQKNNEALIHEVAKERVVVDNLDYIDIIIPLLIALAFVIAFKQAVEQLQLIIEILIGSIVGKICMHNVTLALQKSGMLKQEEDNKDE